MNFPDSFQGEKVAYPIPRGQIKRHCGEIYEENRFILITDAHAESPSNTF